MRIRILLWVLVFLLTSVFTTFAGWDTNPDIRLTQLYRGDLRRESRQLYTDRLIVTFDYLDEQGKSLFKFTPFFEARRNIDRSIWEREEAGIEIGQDIFPWFYFGQAFQRGWMNEDYRNSGVYEKRDYTESETKLLFSKNISPFKQIKIKGFILNEYSYDFDKGQGARNEVSLGVITPIGKYIETGVSWRHIDRIHYYDSDVLEGQLTLFF